MYSDTLRAKDQRPQVLLTVVRAACFSAMLALLAGPPAHAYSWYSGASVGSDGTVYGWGVTNGTPPPGPPMFHLAYITTTLTSPVKHRTASASLNDTPNIARADVSLPFDDEDLGNYVENSDSSAFCQNTWIWFILHRPTQGAALLRMTQYAALRYDNTTTDICGYKMRDRTYQGLDTYGWIPNTEFWKLNETLTSKDGSCGNIRIGADNNQVVGYPDEIKIGCDNPNTCVYEVDQTFSVAPARGQPLTQVQGKDCVGITDPAQCYAQPSHTGWHVRAAATSITVTGN